MENFPAFQNILPKSYYATDALTLSQSLIGKVLVCRTAKGTTAGIISETEAYMGVIDKASHAYGGRRTERTETMYLSGGHAYVYLIYGIYSCMNITANENGNPEAVLIRGVVPCYGFDQMLFNYKTFSSHRTNQKVFNGEKYRKAPYKLTDGPGKLCAAMSIDRSFDKADMCSPDAEIFVTDMGFSPVHGITAKPRIGIDYAEEAALFPWRFTANRADEMIKTV